MVRALPQQFTAQTPPNVPEAILQKAESFCGKGGVERFLNERSANKMGKVIDI